MQSTLVVRVRGHGAVAALPGQARDELGVLRVGAGEVARHGGTSMVRGQRAHEHDVFALCLQVIGQVLPE